MNTLRDENDAPRPEGEGPPVGEAREVEGEAADQAPGEAFLPPGYLAESMESGPGTEEAVEEPEGQTRDTGEAEPGGYSSRSRGGRRQRGVRLGVGASVLLSLVMFLLGGAAGYLGRPVISPEPTSQDPQSALLATVRSKVRHFEGNPNAPVTMIEFSDFQ